MQPGMEESSPGPAYGQIPVTKNPDVKKILSLFEKGIDSV
jgi:hypothetical protein